MPVAEAISFGLATGVLERYGPLATQEDGYRIATARVVVVDYERIFADFEQLRPTNLVAANPGLSSLSERNRTKAVRNIVDAWLLDHAAVISAAQTTQSIVNTPIEICGPALQLFRPPQYGRACIVPTRSLRVDLDDISITVRIPASGELDIKGVGVREGLTPSHDEHSDGLLRLASALEEYVLAHLIERLLDHAGSTHRTLPNYAVLDTGFDGLTATGQHYPTALLVRRAHMRSPQTDLPNYDTQDQYATFDLEMLFRRYGLTSAKRSFLEIRREDDHLVAYQWGKRSECDHETLDRFVKALQLDIPFEAEGVNIQMDFDERSQRLGRQIVDFGHYTARRTFSRAVASGVCDRPLGWGGMLMPGDPCFVQPDSKLIPAPGLWDDETGLPHIGPLDTFTAELVADIQSHKLDRAGISSRISERLQDLVSRWQKPM